VQAPPSPAAAIPVGWGIAGGSPCTQDLDSGD